MRQCRVSRGVEVPKVEQTDIDTDTDRDRDRGGTTGDGRGRLKGRYSLSGLD